MPSRQASPDRVSEQTPLLSRETESEVGDQQENPQTEPAKSKLKRRWPTIVALSVLSVAAIAALVFGFAAPAAVEEYAKEAVSFEPEKLSIDSFTAIGVRARVQGTIWMDANKVSRKSVRDLGRFATWIAKEVESGESEVEVYLPDYQGVMLGKATIPPVKLNIRNQHRNTIDITTDLEPGDVNGFRQVAKDFMDGNLKDILVKAVATVPVRSGLINVGEQTVIQSLRFEGHDVPAVPQFDLKKLQVAEHGLPGHPDGMKAWAELAVMNDYPVRFDVPPVAFELLLPDCSQDYLLVATAKSDVIHILPKQTLNVSATAFMRQLPTQLTSACPGSNKSPLDTFIASYLHGEKTTVYVRGGEQDSETPPWIGKLLKDTIIPVPVPSHPFDDMIKNFSLSNVHFSLPESPTGKPILSATVKVLVGLPKDMNFDVDVGRVRADGTVYYEGEEMGYLDLHKWQESKSSKVDGNLLVESEVVDAPLEITNEEMFSKVVQKMVFGGQGVALGIKATVDVDATTALGSFVVNGIPAKGRIFVKPIHPGKFEHKVGEITVVGSNSSSLTMQARVTIKNPTDYYARIPSANVSLWTNGTRLGRAWASADIKPGKNDVTAYVEWYTGKVGAELLSQYISGYNTTLTIRPDALPGLPRLGLNFTVPMPHMFGKFLKDTTMHILSSTATFILFSPISMFVTEVHATAYYNGSDIGTIDWEYPFAVDPGDNLTPRLPVDWNTPGAGLIRDALGGSLKLDALANVGVKIGEWREQVWFLGKGLGAHVRL